MLAVLPLVGCDEARQAMQQAFETAKAGIEESSLQAVEVTEENLDSFTRQEGTVAVVVYHAEWSDPARRMAPRFEKVAGEYPGELVLGRIDVDKSRRLTVQQKVAPPPDVRIYRGGILVDRFTGERSEEEVRRLFERQVNRLGTHIRQRPVEGSEQGEPAIRPMTRDWVPQGIEKL